MEGQREQLLKTLSCLTDSYLGSIHNAYEIHSQSLPFSKSKMKDKLMSLFQRVKVKAEENPICQMMDRSRDEVIKFEYVDSEDISLQSNALKSSFEHSYSDICQKVEQPRNSQFDQTVYLNHMESEDRQSLQEYSAQFREENPSSQSQDIKGTLVSSDVQSKHQNEQVLAKYQAEYQMAAKSEQESENYDDSSYKCSIKQVHGEWDEVPAKVPPHKSKAPKASKAHPQKHRLTRKASRTYHNYPLELKEKAVECAKQYGLDAAQKMLDVPKKNIMRWINGKIHFNDKGCFIQTRGRKPTDVFMENSVTAWLETEVSKGRYRTQREIRNKAKQFSQQPSFKASKGWLEKFFKRKGYLVEGLSKALDFKRDSTSSLQKNNVAKVEQSD